MNRKSSVILITIALALVSATPVVANHLTGPGQHANVQPMNDGSSPCTGTNTGEELDHYSYATGGVVVKSIVSGTTRNTGASATQIHDECQDDGPLYMGDNEYEWAVNGAFLWTEDHNEAGVLGNLTHNAGPNARRASPANGAGWPNPHHTLAVRALTAPNNNCVLGTGTSTGTLTGCTWVAADWTKDACVEDMLQVTGAAFTIGADNNDNGVVSSGFPQLEPTVVGEDPAAAGGTCAQPFQVAVANPLTSFTSIAYGPTDAGEGPGYDDGTSDIDRNPAAQDPGCPTDGDPTNDCARPNGAGNEHGFWVFIRTTLVVTDGGAPTPYSSVWTRIGET